MNITITLNGEDHSFLLLGLKDLIDTYEARSNATNDPEERDMLIGLIEMNKRIHKSIEDQG